MEYLHVNDMLKRDDINIKTNRMYQIQAKKDTNKINIMYIGEYEYKPLVQIVVLKQHNYEFELISHMITNDDLKLNYYKMIGFLIKKNTKLVAILNYVFVPNIQFDEKFENVEGKFEIILTQNGLDIIIKSYSTYCGKDELIYLITNVLLEIIEKIKT